MPRKMAHFLPVPRDAVCLLAGQLDLLFLGRFAELAQGAGLDLPDPLLGDAQLGADLLERQRLLAAPQAEPPDDDPLLALVETFQNPFDLGLALRSVRFPPRWDRPGRPRWS